MGVSYPEIERKIFMKHTFAKLTGLLIALSLILSGCNLITVDPVMQLDEDIAALKKDYSAVVATYDGGEVIKEEVIANYVYMYSYYSSMYSYFGSTMTEEMVESLKSNVLSAAVQQVAIEKQFDALGLSLGEEKLVELEATADESYQQSYDSFLTEAVGDTDEVRAKQTEYDMYVNGYTKELFLNDAISQAEYETLQAHINGEITEISDEELDAAFAAKVEADETTYASNASGSFETAMSGTDTTVYWVPEGYRTVKHILVIPEADVLAAVTSARTGYSDAQSALEELNVELDALNDDEAADASDETVAADTDEVEVVRTAAEIQADIDQAEADLPTLKTAVETAEAACLASVQSKLDEIYAKIEVGDDFTELIEAYGEDPGMQNEPTMTRGYYVSADSITWDANFTQGSMLLENVGDVSQTPVISTSGIHIIRYETDVTPGAVALEDVREALYEETLTTKQTDHFNEQLLAWTEALNPVYNVDALIVE